MIFFYQQCSKERSGALDRVLVRIDEMTVADEMVPTKLASVSEGQKFQSGGSIHRHQGLRLVQLQKNKGFCQL
jgi:hypothetical protein